MFKFRDGFLLSGDSRLSFVYDKSKHTDNTYKIFCYDDRMGIAYHNGADIEGKQLDVIINEFLSMARRNLTPYALICDLQKYIRALKSDQNTMFYVFGYYGSECKKYYFNLKNDGNIYEYIDSRYVTGGKDNIALDILEKTYDDYMGERDAIIYLDSVYKETQKVEDSVGGPIDILHISPDNGAHWVRRK